MRFPEYPIRKLDKQEKFEQEADVPIIDIIRHGNTKYRENRQKQSKELGSPLDVEPLDFNPKAHGFKLDEERLDITDTGIGEINDAADQLEKLIDKKKEVVLIASSPNWRTHSSALVLEKALRDKGVDILNAEGEIRHFEQMGEQGALLQRRIRSRDEQKERGENPNPLPFGSTEAIEALNFHRFIRHMNNIYQWLRPETKARLEGRRLRVVCLAHQENAMDFLAKTFHGEQEQIYLYGNGQIAEFVPKSKMKTGEDTLTKVTMYPTGGHPGEEALLVRGFEPVVDKQEAVSKFALDAWKYNRTSVENLIAKIGGTDRIRTRLRTALDRDGGKAFGLELCKLITSRLDAGNWRDDIVSGLNALSWKMVKDVRKVDASRNEGKILRSSSPLEDWLDPRSGVERSFVLTYFGDKGLFEYMKEKNQLPDSKYLMQDAIEGFGTVVDIGYSSIHGKVLAKMTYGNARTAGYNLTSATYDTESGVGIWDAETGEPVLPTRNFFHPSMLPPGEEVPSDFFKDLYAAIRESGIDFGVQLEIIVGRGQRGYLVQLRPTSETIFRKIPLPQSPLAHEGTGTLIAESATVNGAFDFTGEAHLFGQDGILENSERVETIETERTAHGKVGIYDEASASGGRKRYLRLDEISSPEIYLGGYLGGAEVQITREAIRPNSHHGVLSGPSEKGAKMYDELDKHCGMVSITRTQMERLTEAVKKAGTTAQLRVVSDGLVARIYLLEK